MCDSPNLNCVEETICYSLTEIFVNFQKLYFSIFFRVSILLDSYIKFAYSLDKNLDLFVNSNSLPVTTKIELKRKLVITFWTASLWTDTCFSTIFRAYSQLNCECDYEMQLAIAWWQYLKPPFYSWENNIPESNHFTQIIW